MIFVVFVFFDTTQGVAMNAIRASQSQSLGAILKTTAFWLLGLFVTLILVFKYSYGIKGVWLGPAIATMSLTFVYMITLNRIEWPELIEKTR